MTSELADRRRAQQYAAPVPVSRADDGLFGPGSSSWRIWSHPAMLVGITRSFVLDMIGNTQGAAALEEHSFYRQDPLGRLRRTVHYFYSVVYGDTEEVATANLRLDRLHQRIAGTDPMTGQAYSALDAYLRLGTQLNTWHSVFYAYEQLGGRPTPDEERDFFAESLTASLEMGLTVEDVRAAATRHGVGLELDHDFMPATREDYRKAWAAAAHCVCVNAQTRRALDAILSPAAPDKRLSTLAKFALYPLLGRVALALIPVEMRHIAGLPCSRIGDAVALTLGRAVAVGLSRTPLWHALLRDLCPQAFELMQVAKTTRAVG